MLWMYLAPEVKMLYLMIFQPVWFPKNSHGKIHGIWWFHLPSQTAKLGGGNSNVFYFHPHLGIWSNLTSIFFKWVGKNQPEKNGGRWIFLPNFKGPAFFRPLKFQLVMRSSRRRRRNVRETNGHFFQAKTYCRWTSFVEMFNTPRKLTLLAGESPSFLIGDTSSTDPLSC